MFRKFSRVAKKTQTGHTSPVGHQFYMRALHYHCASGLLLPTFPLERIFRRKSVLQLYPSELSSASLLAPSIGITCPPLTKSGRWKIEWKLFLKSCKRTFRQRNENETEEKQSREYFLIYKWYKHQLDATITV